MRAAPPLALSAAPSRGWRVACVVLAACAAAAVGTWMAGHLDWSAGGQWAAAAGAGLAGAALGAPLAGPARTVEIRWDGQEWRVDGVPGHLDLMLDAGRWLMLLRLRPADAWRTRWLAIAFGPGAGEQRALRTTLYSAALTPPLPKTPDLRPPGRAPD